MKRPNAHFKPERPLAAHGALTGQTPSRIVPAGFVKADGISIPAGAHFQVWQDDGGQAFVRIVEQAKEQ